MFNIHKITLINFRSYKGTHSFEFPLTYGLYYFTGKNEFEPSLGANGAGKSTFLDAITWVLYGRTTRGLKANEVLSWHASTGAQVVIEISIGNHRYKIKRTQKPNSLLIDDKPVDQKELETHIRLNYAGFTHSVMSPQFGEPFFSMGASEKLTLFSDFMRLNLWLDLSEEASKRAKLTEAELSKLQTEITRDEGQLQLLKDDIKSLKVQEASFETDRKEQLAALKMEAADTFKALKKQGAEIDILRKSLKQREAEEAVLLDWVLKANSKRDATLAELQEATRRIATTRASKETTELKIHNARKMSGTICTRCNQKVDAKHTAREVDALEDQIADYDTIINLEKDVIQRLTTKLVEDKSKLESTTQQANDMSDEIAAIKQKLAVKKSKMEATDANLDRVSESLDKLAKSVNPYEALLGAKNIYMAGIISRIRAHTQKVEDRNSTLIGHNFWIKGFKRIRLFIIEQAFQTLELEVNNCLAQLGMTDWQVTFDVERENKSGGITKGFVVLIKGPSNKDPVKWENWSGGETQRLQLAGDLGLSNLIMQQAGLRNEFEVFDEPSTHLSPEGMMDLADTLHERALAEGKRIWIVDHAAITNFGDFEGTIIARKTENGSSITQQ